MSFVSVKLDETFLGSVLGVKALAVHWARPAPLTKGCFEAVKRMNLV